MSPHLSQEEIFRYTRHIILPEVGLAGQVKLKASSVLIVGTGGLGSPISMYLAAAGVGHIGIVDYDMVDSSNLQRQVIHDSTMVGKPKVESARQRMLNINPYIQVDAINEVFSSENAHRISSGYDILVDGTDNFPTRYLINDLCVLTARPYVYGSIFRFEGQISIFDARLGPCYRCLFAEPPPPGTMPTCAEGGVFGVLPGTVGTIQAAETIKLILGIGTPLIGKLMLFDALDMSFQTVQLRKNLQCKICSSNPEITTLVDYEAFCGVPIQNHLQAPLTGHDIEPRVLAERLKNEEAIQLIDVRDPVESQISHLAGAISIPHQQIERRIAELNVNQDIVLFCRTGVRSAQALNLLINAGFKNVWHLRGGINAWADEMDKGMFKY
jgi:molybdopterin/thiamine biosynthesis adenylyltransferase/rhodanese-related sulfurtransferase